MTEAIETHPVTKACDPCYSGEHENCLEGPCRCYHRGTVVEPGERAYPAHDKLHETVPIGWGFGRSADVPRAALSQALGDFLSKMKGEGYDFYTYEEREVLEHCPRASCENGRVSDIDHWDPPVYRRTVKRRQEREDAAEVDCPKCGGTGEVTVMREGYWPHPKRTIQDLLGDYLGIDTQAMAEEKSAMLDAIHEDRG